MQLLVDGGPFKAMRNMAWGATKHQNLSGQVAEQMQAIRFKMGVTHLDNQLTSGLEHHMIHFTDFYMSVQTQRNWSASGSLFQHIMILPGLQLVFLIYLYLGLPDVPV